MTESSTNDIRNKVLCTQPHSNSRSTKEKKEKNKASSQKRKLRKLLGNSKDVQTKKHSIYLKISIKTANLLIFALCINAIAFIQYLALLPSWVSLIVVLSNYVAMYLSFAFVSRHYRCLFSPFKNICYSGCNKLCFYCCCIDKISDDLELQVTMSNPYRGQKSKNHLDLPNLNYQPSNTATFQTKSSFDIPSNRKLSIGAAVTMSNSFASNMSYISSSFSPQRKFSGSVNENEHEHEQTKSGDVELPPDMLKCHSNSDPEDDENEDEEMDMEGIVIVNSMSRQCSKEEDDEEEEDEEQNHEINVKIRVNTMTMDMDDDDEEKEEEP